MKSTIFVLALIGIAVVVRRMLFVLHPPAVAVGVDVGFAAHPALTMAHIVPGLLFMVLAPLQLLRSLRTRRPAWHRWAGRVVVAAALVIGVTALVMSPQMAIGGLLETAATSFFGALFLYSLARGFVAIRRGNIAEHRIWMIRMFAVGIAVAAIRPIVGIFFATARLTHLTPHDFFGIAFWLGFTGTILAAELWLRRKLAITPRHRA